MIVPNGNSEKIKYIRFRSFFSFRGDTKSMPRSKRVVAQKRLRRGKNVWFVLREKGIHERA